MKVLITGGSGLLGQYLNIELSKKYEILTLYNQHPGNCGEFNSFKIDITDFENLDSTHRRICSPNIISSYCSNFNTKAFRKIVCKRSL